MIKFILITQWDAGYNICSATSKAKKLVLVQPDFCLFWNFLCVTCIKAYIN